MTFNPDNPKEHWKINLSQKEIDNIDKIKEMFNGTILTEKESEELNMSFNLGNYKAEAPKDSAFEPFKYEGPVSVNSAKVVQSEQASEFYGTGVGANIFELELQVLQGENEGRRIWRRWNLDTTVADKKGKLPVQKLADQLFTLGIEFTDLETLQTACDKLVTIKPIIKAWKAKIGKDDTQQWNFKGVATDNWEEQGSTATTGSSF